MSREINSLSSILGYHVLGMNYCVYIYMCVLHVYVIKHDFPRDRFTSAIITFDITKDSKDGQQPCIKVRPAQFPSQ